MGRRWQEIQDDAGGGAPWPTHGRLPGPAAVTVSFVLLFQALGASPAAAQLGSSTNLPSASPPRVFLDCQARWACRNTDLFREEVNFVHWVRDREDADVHVIFTMTGAAGGSSHFTFDFIGRGDLAGMDDELTFTSDGRDVQAEVMDGLVRAMSLGLLRYAVEKGMGGGFALEFTGDVPSPRDEAAADDAEGSEAQFHDPWNYWTFQVGLSADADIEEARSDTRFRPSVSADRVTEAWKVNLSADLDVRRDRRDLADGTKVRDDRSEWTVSGLLVRSVGERVAVGVDVDTRSSVRRNQHARLQLNPAVEWNYYPYAQAQRRQLIVHYSAGMERSNYRQETFLGATEETLPQHKLGVQYRAREEWGNAGVGLDASQYLHQGGLYSFGISGELSYRIVRGLEMNVSASAAVVNDNIYTPADAISDEDILLGRQALPSSYEYEMSLGFNYRWGSTFANIVNHRFPRSVR